MAVAYQRSHRPGPGVVDVANGVMYDSPSIRIAPRGPALAALRALRPAVAGDALSALAKVRSQTNFRARKPRTGRVAVAGGSGMGQAARRVHADRCQRSATAIGDVAALSTQRLVERPFTTRTDKRQIRVTAKFRGRQPFGRSSRASGGPSRQDPVAARLYGVDRRRGTIEQPQSFAEFANVIGIAIVLVFAVMLATFRSFRLPLVILTAIPLALIGVALGLFVTGTHFNVSSFMGLLLLVGFVVKNGILLIDVANRSARGRRHDRRCARGVAGNTRLRPIVMTTLAAIGGLFPLAFGIGQAPRWNSRWRSP